MFWVLLCLVSGVMVVTLAIRGEMCERQREIRRAVCPERGRTLLYGTTTVAAVREDWSRKFDRWSVGPSTTESEKCENAERMIHDALKAHEGLKARTIKVFVQESYRNRTNVRSDSDVDICVLCLVHNQATFSGMVK